MERSRIRRMEVFRPVGSTDRGKTVTKPLFLHRLGLSLSEKQIPQIVENVESGYELKRLWSRLWCL